MRICLAAAVAMGVGVVAAFDDDIAQLARYLFFGALLTWLELVALACAHRP